MFTPPLYRFALLRFASPLRPGRRYYFCVKAGPTTYTDVHGAIEVVRHNLEACSDGVTIDIQPPSAGAVTVGNRAGHGATVHAFVTSTQQLHAEWVGFRDLDTPEALVHSHGIASFTVSLLDEHSQLVSRNAAVVLSGDANGYTFTDLELINGNVYHVRVKATDHVALTSTAMSSPITVDTTGPEIGSLIVKAHFVDNGRASHRIALDFTEAVDAESGIVETICSLGTFKHGDDIVSGVVSMGSHCVLELTRPSEHHVYATVTAVNGAGRTTTACEEVALPSLSAASCGFVSLARNMRPVAFVTSTAGLQVSWRDFALDTAKAILCVGSDEGHCDIAMLNDIRSSRGVMPIESLSLPSGMPIYATIRVSQDGKMVCHASSAKLQIDSTPPVEGVVSVGRESGSMPYWANREAIALSWLGFVDAESGIQGYSWCLGTEAAPCSILPYRSVGLADSAYVKLPQMLDNGTVIVATVRATNAAGLTTAVSSAAVPVHAGEPTFTTKPTVHSIHSNDDAHSLYQPTRTSVNVAWQGSSDALVEYQLQLTSEDGTEAPATRRLGRFGTSGALLTGLDLHDGNSYTAKGSTFIAIGRSFGASDANFGGKAHVHTSGAQEAAILLGTELKSGQTYFLTITCVNKAGVPSKATHASGIVTTIGYGIVIQLSRLDCTSANCEGECVCGFEHRCDAAGSRACVATQQLSGVELSAPSTTASSDVVVLNRSGVGSRRVQFSLSLKDMPAGDGVFVRGEDIWHDFGPATPVVFTLPRKLLARQAYTAHMRVWTSSFEYQLIRSNDINLVTSAPQLPAITLQLNPNNSSKVLARWSIDAVDPNVSRLQVGLGTYPGSVDLVSFTPVSTQAGNVSFTVPIAQAHATAMYATMEGYTLDGLEAARISNPLRVDKTGPAAGTVRVVHDNMAWKHHPYVGTTNGSLAWSGFADAVSGIKEYHVCVKPEETPDCTTQDWVNVGRVSQANLPANLTAGGVFKAQVRAVNAAGLSSNTSSATFIVDTSPPHLAQPLALSVSFVASTINGRAGGVLSITASWTALDDESTIHIAVLMLGTTAYGQQLLAPTVVASSPATHLVSVTSCPTAVHATLVIRNGVGLTAEFAASYLVQCTL
eukprot:TRINITY_DN11947_c0_g1_i6.p1 TRINITY_DN11947_c0_g1~~TRINITY_DN11947_c0_g1_i6.p1  ORF type:complete len:1115 (+),score=165.45 TRINITY_DN11947_c0_g1_i6:506-3850(+)